MTRPRCRKGCIQAIDYRSWGPMALVSLLPECGDRKETGEEIEFLEGIECSQYCCFDWGHGSFRYVDRNNGRSASLGLRLMK